VCGVPPSKNSLSVPMAISYSIKYERMMVPTEYFASPARFICQSISVHAVMPAASHQTDPLPAGLPQSNTEEPSIDIIVS